MPGGSCRPLRLCRRPRVARRILKASEIAPTPGARTCFVVSSSWTYGAVASASPSGSERSRPTRADPATRASGRSWVVCSSFLLFVTESFPWNPPCICPIPVRTPTWTFFFFFFFRSSLHYVYIEIIPSCTYGSIAFPLACHLTLIHLCSEDLLFFFFFFCDGKWPRETVGGTVRRRHVPGVI